MKDMSSPPGPVVVLTSSTGAARPAIPIPAFWQQIVEKIKALKILHTECDAEQEPFYTGKLREINGFNVVDKLDSDLFSKVNTLVTNVREEIDRTLRKSGENEKLKSGLEIICTLRSLIALNSIYA